MEKLSDELKRCLYGSGCGNCEYHEADTKFICRGLLEKAYERIKGYENMFHCKVGDTVYFIKSAFSYMAEPKEEKVRKIELVKGETIFRTENRAFRADNIGKTVFLTREQAESALQKMNEMEGKE